jgi:hypothetical protein
MSLEHERIHDAFMDGKLAGEANYKQKVREVIDQRIVAKEIVISEYIAGYNDALKDLKKELGYNND